MAQGELRLLRANPNVLEPGDVVVIPDKQSKDEGCPTGQRHVFFTPTLTEELVLRCESERNKPLAGKAYILTIDGSTFAGTTDGAGELRQDIPVGAQRGKLEIEGFLWLLEVGSLNPVDEKTLDNGVTGAQGRLRNLGYYFGPIDGRPNDALTTALESFESDEKLPITGTGELSPPTAARLKQRHGC